MANLITISRFPLLLGFLLMLYLGEPPVKLLSVPYLFVALMLDTVDGMVARRRQAATLMGSVLDIAADRVYELALWVALADLGAVPVAIPLIVITRTTLTDAVRSIGLSKGKAPFEQHQSPLGRFLVGSPWMRSGYSLSKIASFCGLTLALALAGFPEGSQFQSVSATVLNAFRTLAWIAVAFCIVRGAPVILSGYRQVRRPLTAPEST